MHIQRIIKSFAFATFVSVCSLVAASPTSQEAVAKKFSRDKVSFAQFLFFGKMHCLDRYVGSSRNFTSAYGIAFNYLYPLPRIFKQEALGESFNAIESSRLDTKAFKPNNTRIFEDPLDICSKIYRSNTINREIYTAFVSQREALHSADDVDIDVNMQDYLNGFFVRVPQ